MKIFLNIAILLIQGFAAFISSFAIYMIFALFDYQGGIDGFVGITIFQPILGALISILTIIVCFLVGLPIRFIEKINSFWSKYYFPILGIALGVVLLFSSFTPSLMETIKTVQDNLEVTKEIPNLKLVIIGWFVTAFSILHTFPPKKFLVTTEIFLTNFIGPKG
jgi:hypothetical protein